ncbi:Uncharacterised protein [Vibrio cholerae]|nr:Uncharacterised protein [Vibrio cholerae]CSC28931.1 Uncharacterised protein [Vibrio cholerae]CSC40213.1 Uncharacterised protein [Vibrio cholerae]CSC50205.1 Uncharacterised protein [Vibrio cholerae]CSC65868.1 Uncharacterised protein [Vibrio cholerae]
MPERFLVVSRSVFLLPHNGFLNPHSALNERQWHKSATSKGVSCAGYFASLDLSLQTSQVAGLKRSRAFSPLHQYVPCVLFLRLQILHHQSGTTRVKSLR